MEFRKLKNTRTATKPCWKCGSERAIGEVYCPECGRRVAEDIPDIPNRTNQGRKVAGGKDGR